MRSCTTQVFLWLLLCNHLHKYVILSLNKSNIWTVFIGTTNWNCFISFCSFFPYILYCYNARPRIPIDFRHFLGKKENLLNCYQYVIHTYICDFLANIYNTVIKLNHYFCVKLAYYFKAFTNHQKKSPSVTVPFDLVKTKK